MVYRLWDDVAYLRKASSFRFFVISAVSLDSIDLMSQLTPKEPDEVLKLAARSKKPAHIHTKIAALLCWRRADLVDIITITFYVGQDASTGSTQDSQSKAMLVSC